MSSLHLQTISTGTGITILPLVVVMPRQTKPSPFTAVGNKGLTRAQIQQKIRDYARTFVYDSEYCINSKSRRTTECQCLRVFRDENRFERLIEKLDKYEIQNPQGRQLLFMGL